MEFSHLLAELKNASEEYGKDVSQNSIETSQFCQTVCKVADNLEKHIKKYENQIIGLWVIYGYVTELYPRLERGQSTSTLCQKLFNASAQIVLDVQFGQLDEDQPYKSNFRNTLTAFHQVVSEREGSSRFSVILSLMETHWTHPVLGQVMSNDEDDEEGSGLEYITSEDPDILRLRVEMMLQQNCEEFALNLCTWCLKHPALKFDLDIRQIQLTLMNKLHDLDRLQEEAETLSPKECVTLVERFMELPKNQKVCTVLTQTFLVQNWIKEGDDEETIELFKLWIKHQYMVDEEEPYEDKFISNLWAIAKLSRTTEQIVLIIDLIREQCGDSLLQFYTDMCIYALNIDKSVLEKSMQNGEMSEIQTHQQDMSLTCCKLADIFRYNKLKTARYSIVTAFSLNPSYSSLTKVESFYKSDNPALLVDTGQHKVAKCCGNCTYNRGVCVQKDKEEKDTINLATVYEVERLLNMLRPYHLKPELSWKELGPACTKYLQERERILTLMADAEAKKKAQPNQLSHQQLAASLREKLLVTAGHNKTAQVEPKPPPKPVPVPVPVVTVEASTETKSYASNLQQVVENLQKRLGKAPASAHSKVRPRTGQSINLAKNSGNIVNSYSMNSSANQLPTASQILAQKKSDAESIRQRTTQQIAATIQQTFLRQHEPEKPNFMVRVHNTNPSQTPITGIRQSFVNPSNQPPQRFLSRPQELNKQYLVRLQQQQASKVRMVNPQHHQTVQQTMKSPQQFSNPNPQKIQKISPSGHVYSQIQVNKGQIIQGYQQLQHPVSQRVNQGIVSVGYQNTRPQIRTQSLQPSTQFHQRVQTTQIQPQHRMSSASTVQSMRPSQAVVNRVIMPPTQYTQGQKQPTSQEVIQQAKHQLYTLSQKKSPSQPRVLQPPDALISANTSAPFVDPGSNAYSTSQGGLQMQSSAGQFQQAQQLLQTQSLKPGDVKPTKARGLPISSSSAHQATLALANKSKMIKKRPVTASQNQLLAKAEAQGYASGKAVVKILQSQGMNLTSPTSPGSPQIPVPVMQAAPKLYPGNNQQLMNVGSQQYGSRIVTLNQPQQVIQKTVIQSPTSLSSSSIQQVISNQQVYQQHILSTQLNPVQTDLNTLLTVASANTRPNSSQSIAVAPTSMHIPVYRTMPQNVLNPTVLSVQSDLSSITPTIPQLDSQQFRQLQNQVTASQSQHTIPTPNLSAQQLQEELNKINQHSQPIVTSNADLTITVKPSHHVASSNVPKLQPNMLRPKISTQSAVYRHISNATYSPNQQVINHRASPLSSTAPQLHRMLIQPDSSYVPQIPKQTIISDHSDQGYGDQNMSVYGHTSQKYGNVAFTSSQQLVPEVIVKTEEVQQDVNAVDPSTPEQESLNSDKYAEEQKNIFVKSLLNASDEILETLSALPDPSLITDLFKNANPGDELHIELSGNIEDLGIDDMSSLIIPETDAESIVNNSAEVVEQANVEEPAFVPMELDPAAQSLRDVQGIHFPDYGEQYQVNSQQNTHFTMLNPSSHQISEAYGLKVENNDRDREPTIMTERASTLSKKCGSVFKCIICSATFSTLESLQWHVQRVCKPDDSPTNIHESLKLPDSKSGGINAKTIYQCVKCSSICISEKEMQLHTKNCPKDNAHLFGSKKSGHTSVLPSANKEYQSVKRLVEKQQMEIQKEKEMIKAKKDREQQLKKIQALKVVQKQKELKLKREAAKLAKAPPPPRFKEMTSSSGKTFYKCDLCGQTFCSPEGVHDHWLPCLKKNPITKRIRRPNPEKQKMLENPEKFTKMMSTIFDSVVGPTDSSNDSPKESGNDKDNEDTKDSEEATEDEKDETADDQKSPKDDKVNGDSVNQKNVKPDQNDAEEDRESTEDKQEEDGNDVKDAEKDKSSQDEEEGSEEDAQSSISTGTDISESDRSLRKRRAIRTPRYFFSSDSDEDMKKAKKLSQMETAKTQIFPEVELARLKKNSTCCLCSVKLKDMTMKLQHFAVKHLKIHTYIKSWKGHSFKCDLCNVKFNVYTKYVFHLKDHETEILMKISKMLGKDGSSKTVVGRPQITDAKLSLLAARKSVKKHLSPMKKTAPMIYSGRKRGRPSNKEKPLKPYKKHREDPKSDSSDQRSQRRNVRAAHTQALSKIKNNANGFDILNTLPHFNVDVSSSGHSRSCSPELIATRRQTRSRRTSSVRKLTRDSDEESSQPDMSDKEIELSDKETENSQESLDSRDTEVKLSDLEAEDEANSETNESQDKDTTDQDSVYKPSASEDSQTSDQSSNLENKGPSFMSSFMDFIGEGPKEKKVTNENIQTSSSCSSLLGYRADPALHRHLYKNIGKYKGTVKPEPKKIQRGRRSVATMDDEDSKEKPQERSRRLSDSDILTKHKHLLKNTELRVVLQKLPEDLTDQTPGEVESVHTSTSDDTIIERGLSEERRLDSPAVNSPAISEVSSRARSEEVEVIMMADTSPSHVISCLLGSNTGSPPLTVVGNCNNMKAQKSSEIVKLDNEEDDIILIEKNSDEEEEIEDADDNTGDGDPDTVGASLTTCVVVKADTPPEGVKPSSSDLIIIENRSEPVNVFPNTAKNDGMTETNLEISQNNVTEIHVVEGAKISLLADQEKLPISEETCGSSITEESAIDSKDLCSSNTESSKPNLDSSESSNSRSSESKPESPIPAIDSSESQDHESMNQTSLESSLPLPESPIPALTDFENTENQSDSPIPAIDSKTPTVMSTSPKSEMQAPEQLPQPEATPEMMSMTETQSPLVESKSEAVTKILVEFPDPEVTPNTESPIQAVDLNPRSAVSDADSKFESQHEVKASSELPIPADNSNFKLEPSISNDQVKTEASTESPIPAVEPISNLEIPETDAPSTLDAYSSLPQSLKSESPIPALSLESKLPVVEIQSKIEVASSSSELAPDSPIPGVFLTDVQQTSCTTPSAAEDFGPTPVATEDKEKRPSSKLFEALTKDLPQSRIKSFTSNKMEGQQDASNSSDILLQTEASRDTSDISNSKTENQVQKLTDCQAISITEAVPSPKGSTDIEVEIRESNNDETVATETELAAQTEHLPSPTEQLSSPTEQLSSPSEQLPSPTEHQPSPIEQQPSPTEQLPSPTEQQPSPTEQQPSLSVEKNKDQLVTEPLTLVDDGNDTINTEDKHSSNIDNKEFQEMDSSDPQNVGSEERANESLDVIKEDSGELPQTASKDQSEVTLSTDIEADELLKEDTDPEVISDESEGDVAGSQPTPTSCDTSDDQVKKEIEDKGPEPPLEEDSSTSCKIDMDSLNDRKQDSNPSNKASFDAKDIPKNSQEYVAVDSLPPEDNKAEELLASKKDHTGIDSKDSTNENVKSKSKRIPEVDSKGTDSNDEEKATVSEDCQNCESERIIECKSTSSKERESSKDTENSETKPISENTDTNVQEKDSDSKDLENLESKTITKSMSTNVQAKDSDLTDLENLESKTITESTDCVSTDLQNLESESITESKNSEVKGKASSSKQSMKDAKKVLKSRQPISVTDTRFVRSVAHSIKLLNSNKFAELKIVDYSESDSEIDSESANSSQIVSDSLDDPQPTEPVIEASTDEPSSGSTASSSKDAVADSTSSKTIDVVADSTSSKTDVEEDVPKEESKEDKKPREAHSKSGELLTSIASKDFSSKDLPLSVADNLSKMPKIGSSVITKSGNTHKILDVKITQPEKPEEEDFPESGKRSGLIQSLREQIKVEPFKWDEEEEDSPKKKSFEAVQSQSGNVAPFTWDASESKLSSSKGSSTKRAKVENTIIPKEDPDPKKGTATKIVSKGTHKKVLEVTAIKDIKRPGSSSKSEDPKGQNPALKEDFQHNNSKNGAKDTLKSQNSAVKDGHIKKSGNSSKIDPKEDLYQKSGSMDTKQLKDQYPKNKVEPGPKHSGNSSKVDSRHQQNSIRTEDQFKKESAKTKSSTTELKRKNSVEADDSKQKRPDSSTRPASSSTPNQSLASKSKNKSADSTQSIRSSSVHTPLKSIRGRESSKNSSDSTDKYSTRSSTKPFVRTSERQRLRQLSPNKFTRYSPSKSLSPLKKSLNHLRYRDKNGKNIRTSPIRIGHPLKNLRRSSDKSEEDRKPKSTLINDKSSKDQSNVSSSNRESDKPTPTLHRENSEIDLHNTEKKLKTLKRQSSDLDLHNNEKKHKSTVETSSNSSETSNSDNPSPVRRSKRRLERLHRKLCCDEDHDGDKKRKLDDATNCRHGPSSTCSSCVGKKVDIPLPAVVRRSSNYRRHSYHHTQEIKKVKHSSTPPTRNVTMVRVECDSASIKDSRGHQRTLSERDRKQSDTDNKWKFRPRNKNKKYPYTYTRAREKE